MFGGFGQTNQQSQQPVFGFNAASSTPATSTQPTLFGSQPATQTGGLNLFGSSTPTSQATSQPVAFFGTATSQQSTPLFGQSTPSSGATPSLFGSNTSTQPVQTNLFGSTSAAGQLGSTLTSTSSLLGSQPKTPLFGQTTTATTGIAPAPLNLFGSTTQTSQPSLFGSNLGSTNQTSTGNLFSSATTQPQQQNVMYSAFAAMPPTGKNSPLEHEVQSILLDQLKALREKIKNNYEYTSKSGVHFEPEELNESMANAEQFLRTVKSTTGVVFSDAKEFAGKVTSDVCNCKELIEINKQKKLHPSQASDQLCQLLFKFGGNLHTKIDKLNDKVYELEQPLRDYINWKENGMESQTIGKLELMEHVSRIVEICNLACMNSTSLINKTEQLKILYMAYLRQLHGNNVKSPFKSEETLAKNAELFEYDPQRGMNVPNIFPSTTALLSLVGSMQKSIVGQQSAFGSGFSQPQPTNTSFFGSQRPSPFSLGTTSTSTTGTSALGTSLFSKPLAVATPVTTTSATSLFSSTTPNTTKPAFSLPAVNVSTPSFGSTLNSSSSGTLFGGSVTKPPSLFGAK